MINPSIQPKLQGRLRGSSKLRFRLERDTVSSWDLWGSILLPKYRSVCGLCFLGADLQPWWRDLIPIRPSRWPSSFWYRIQGTRCPPSWQRGSHIFLHNKGEPELTPPGSYRYDLLKNPTLSPRSRHRVPSAVPLRPQRRKSYLSRYWAWHGRMVARYASICLYSKSWFF